MDWPNPIGFEPDDTSKPDDQESALTNASAVHYTGLFEPVGNAQACEGSTYVEDIANIWHDAIGI